MFNLFTKRSVGIDIADRTIEVVEIIKDRKGTRIWSKGRVLLTPGIVERGLIKDKVKLKEALKKALQGAKPHPIITKRAVFGLPECQVYIHNFYIKEHKKEEREDIILKEARANVPLDEDDLLFSYKILPPLNKKTEILLVAVSRKAAMEWYNFFNESGVDVDVFDIESLAVFRGLFTKPVKAPVCVVDIGSAGAHVAIFDNNGLWYAYGNDIAGNALTAEIVKALEKSESEAEELKKEIGLSRPTEKIFFALTKVLHPLVEDIKTTFDYFKEKTGESVEEIVLVGGSSKLKGLADYIQTNIGIPTRIGKSPLLKAPENLVYIEAVGLALRGVESRWDQIDPSIIINNKLKNKKMNNLEKKEDTKIQSGEDTQNEKKETPQRAKFSMPARRGKWTIILISTLVFCLIASALVFWYRSAEKSRQEESTRAKVEAVKALEKIKSDRMKKEEKIKAELEAAERAAEQTPKAVIKETPTGWLNVRSGPGTNYSKSGKVYPEESYELLEEKNNWYKIKIDDETEGWVASQYAEKQ